MQKPTVAVRQVLTRATVGLLTGALALGALGCGHGAKTRSGVPFQAKGVRQGIQAVLREVPSRQQYPMLAATDQLARALSGLPVRVKESGAADGDPRLAAADKAIRFFEQLRPVLESLRYDEPDVVGKLGELSRMVDEVDKG